MITMRKLNASEADRVFDVLGFRHGCLAEVGNWLYWLDIPHERVDLSDIVNAVLDPHPHYPVPWRRICQACTLSFPPLTRFT